MWVYVLVLQWHCNGSCIASDRSDWLSMVAVGMSDGWRAAVRVQLHISFWGGNSSIALLLCLYNRVIYCETLNLGPS